MTAPKPLLRLLALFDAEIRSMLPAIGTIERVSNAAATHDLGIDFIPVKDALLASAKYLVDNRLV